MTTLIITINDIITAGVAITAFSLFLYSMAFNLRNKVARSFLLVLLCIVIVYAAEAIAGNLNTLDFIEALMYFQWLGIIWLPAAYIVFSKALLSTTGIGIKKSLYWLPVIASTIFSFLLLTGSLVGSLVQDQSPAPHLQPTIWSDVFVVYYGLSILSALYNVYRARKRARTHSTRRRMTYLLIGCMAPAIGSFPYLIYGNTLAEQIPDFFWIIALSLNIITGTFIVIMAYSIAFFGVAYPDRVVKNRLARWLLRGPVTAVLTLGITTVVRRVGEHFGITYSAFVPISMVSSILLLEYMITLFGHHFQHWFFNGNNNNDLLLLESLQFRLVTKADLEQLLEMTLAAIRDLTRANAGVVMSLENDDLILLVESGMSKHTISPSIRKEDWKNFQRNPETADGFASESFIFIPLLTIPAKRNKNEEQSLSKEFIGLLGLESINIDEMEEEQSENFFLLVERIEIALNDHLAQRDIFAALRNLSPGLDRIQQLRAAGTFGQPAANNRLINTADQMSKWIKDALTHYWGGPKLSNNPLNDLRIIQSAIADDGISPANALRNTLRNGIEKMKPVGKQQFTTEWLLYNILQLKFLEGKKVREIAAQLSISEADFYRKQRVAVNELAKIILQMENDCTSL
ncbi:MAG: hypothetical protein K8R40_04740 [Anaerolineaceae bacterium]|nr:hypothetical protein [Anaerolineaceae bacterium]